MENLHLPQTKCKALFAYMQILHVHKSGHVYAKQILHTRVFKWSCVQALSKRKSKRIKRLGTVTVAFQRL